MSHHHDGQPHDLDGQPHDHDGHAHDHDGHAPASDAALPAWADAAVPDTELSPRQLSRRGVIRGAGLLGAGAGAMSVFGGAPAFADQATARPDPSGGEALVYLAGDHHIHTQSSSDGLYRVSDQARRGAEFGLDWMVITDHGGLTHSKLGVVNVNPDIKAARVENPRALLFQGLEWNIPAAEHATVFVAPGDNEVSVLQQFEQDYDGVVKGATDGTAGGPVTAANEALAVAGLQFLAAQKASGVVADALMLANHPARKGLDSPHEVRAWRDATDGIAIGMEGAPGHQAAAIPAVGHETNGRGYYDTAPSSTSFPAYPLESYVTYGGFDWMTATVGGLWDSLLAEGRPWWVTANSDSHTVYDDTLVRGVFAAGETFDTLGRYPNPVDGGVPIVAQGDFFPGQYSRTHVGAASYGYLQVMDGLRKGRVWVDHGQLIEGLSVQVKAKNPGLAPATLGGVATVKRGGDIVLTITIDTADRPNNAGVLPTLNRVDVIRGFVTGAAVDVDSFNAPTAQVVKSFDTSGRTGRFTLTLTLTKVRQPLYLRIRGTDGNRTQPGLLGSSVDPFGPAADVRGSADPWADLWFYANPIFVNVAG